MAEGSKEDIKIGQKADPSIISHKMLSVFIPLITLVSHMKLLSVRQFYGEIRM